MVQFIPKWLADFGLWINRLYYKQLLESTYFRSERPPSWFDHRIDLHYLWPQNLFWLERGVFPRKYMLPGCAVLDLFCGDGFFSRYFYSTIAARIDAIDKDPLAIEHARRWHSHPKIRYTVSDVIHEPFPESHYDVVVWFEAIEHVNEVEYRSVINQIKSALGETGILFGSTPIVAEEKRGQANWEHQNEFHNLEDLHRFLEKDFRQIQLDLTIYPEFHGSERRTAYFTVGKPK